MGKYLLMVLNVIVDLAVKLCNYLCLLKKLCEHKTNRMSLFQLFVKKYVKSLAYGLQTNLVGWLFDWLGVFQQVSSNCRI